MISAERVDHGQRDDGSFTLWPSLIQGCLTRKSAKSSLHEASLATSPNRSSASSSLPSVAFLPLAAARARRVRLAQGSE